MCVCGSRQDVEAVLKVQLGLTSLVMTAVLYPVATWALPAAIHIQGVPGVVTPLTCFFCIISGLWGGCIIGFITEYYTSHSYQPVGIPSPLSLRAVACPPGSLAPMRPCPWPCGMAPPAHVRGLWTLDLLAG